jgi:hypothetical protein
MTAQDPMPASFDCVPGLKGVCCCECESHIAAAKRELGALVTAVGRIFGDAEADRAAEDWIKLAEDRNIPLVNGYPEWRRLTAAAIEQLAERRDPRQNQQQREE